MPLTVNVDSSTHKLSIISKKETAKDQQINSIEYDYELFLSGEHDANMLPVTCVQNNAGENTLHVVLR